MSMFFNSDQTAPTDTSKNLWAVKGVVTVYIVHIGSI